MFGRRSILLASLFIFSVFSLATGFSRGGLTLDIPNGVMGLSCASVIPSAQGMLGSIYHTPSKRKKLRLCLLQRRQPPWLCLQLHPLRGRNTALRIAGIILASCHHLPGRCYRRLLHGPIRRRREAPPISEIAQAIRYRRRNIDRGRHRSLLCGYQVRKSLLTQAVRVCMSSHRPHSVSAQMHLKAGVLPTSLYLS